MPLCSNVSDFSDSPASGAGNRQQRAEHRQPGGLLRDGRRSSEFARQRSPGAGAQSRTRRSSSRWLTIGERARQHRQASPGQPVPGPVRHRSESRRNAGLEPPLESIRGSVTPQPTCGARQCQGCREAEKLRSPRGAGRWLLQPHSHRVRARPCPPHSAGRRNARVCRGFTDV